MKAVVQPPTIPLTPAAKTEREKVFEKIDAERRYQEEKWGTAFDRANTPNDWVTYITKYLGQSVTLPWDYTTFRTQMLKVAALAVACLEQPDYAERHYDGNYRTPEGRVGRKR